MPSYPLELECRSIKKVLRNLVANEREGAEHKSAAFRPSLRDNFAKSPARSSDCRVGPREDDLGRNRSNGSQSSGSTCGSVFGSGAKHRRISSILVDVRTNHALPVAGSVVCRSMRIRSFDFERGDKLN